jgi:hypothetical protein
MVLIVVIAWFAVVMVSLGQACHIHDHGRDQRGLAARVQV